MQLLSSCWYVIVQYRRNQHGHQQCIGELVPQNCDLLTSRLLEIQRFYYELKKNYRNEVIPQILQSELGLFIDA